MLSAKAPLLGRFSFAGLFASLGALCFVLAWLAPNHYLPWLSFHNEVPMFAALVLLATTAAFGTRGHMGLPRGWWIMPTLLIGAIVLQYAWGLVLYRGNALLGLLYVTGVAMAWWLGAASMRLVHKPDRYLAVGAALLVLVAVLSAAVEMLQWLRMETSLNMYAVERAPGARPSGNLAQPNLLATLLVMATVAVGFLWRVQRLRGWQAAVLLVYLSFALTMTESRTGLLGAACVGGFILLRARPLGWSTGWRAVLAWWGLLVLFWWSWSPLNELLLLSPARALEVRLDGVRRVLWMQVADAIAQRPWWGYGWNQTPVAQKAGVAAAPGEWTTDYAHNVVLDWMAWFGVPLGLILAGVLLWWLWRTARLVQDGADLALFCMALPVLLHSLLEFPFAYAFFLFPVACIFGALHARQVPHAWPVQSEVRRWPHVAAAGLLALYSLVAGRIFVEYLEAEEDMRVMRFEMRRVGQRPPDHVAPRLLFLNQLDEMLKLGRMQPTRGMAPKDLERMARANAFHNWASLHLNYVIALGVNGQQEEAGRQLRVLRDLYGQKSYAQARAEFVAQRDIRFPELTTVVLP